jgi:hypothetical protein
MDHFKFKIKRCQYHLLCVYYTLSILLKPVQLKRRNTDYYKVLSFDCYVMNDKNRISSKHNWSMLKKAEFEGICFAYLHHEAYKEGG